MKINNAGLQIIKDSESVRLQSYLCPAGIPTIGYGHTGDDVKLGMTISMEKAEEYLRLDVEDSEKGVSEYVMVSTTENQFSAFVSFVYNVGIENFKNSTLLKDHNKRSNYDCCKDFHDWRKGGGKVLRGLVIRRLKEAYLYIK